MDLLSGVKNLELIPQYGDSINISPRIARLISESESIRAAIAFWTLSYEKLTSLVSPDKITAFYHSKSFLCTDIQAPTNIDALSSLCKEKMNIYLNLRRLHPSYKKETSSPGLLHTKIILADRKNGEAELWIGSHNWTQFAITGPNIEATLAITCDRTSPIYSQAQYFLKYIRDKLCDAFDISMTEIYKNLQATLAGNEKPAVDVIVELESDKPDLARNNVVLFFGSELEDFQSLRNIGKEVKLLVHDTHKGDIHLYATQIIQAGEMIASNPNAASISFTKAQRFAFSKHGGFPFLRAESLVPDVILTEAHFFVAFQIEQKEFRKFTVSDYSQRRDRLWVNDNGDDSFIKMHSESNQDTAGTRNKFFEDQYPKVQIPKFKTSRQEAQRENSQAYLALPLDEKRQLDKYRLIRKGIINYKE